MLDKNFFQIYPHGYLIAAWEFYTVYTFTPDLMGKLGLFHLLKIELAKKSLRIGKNKDLFYAQLLRTPLYELWHHFPL